MKPNAHLQRGVSLIEAVVAMAIMGFGMLGVLGMQSALRSNADTSKQRSEAVRIAQETIETQRSFSVLAATAGAADYDAIATAAAVNIARANANATFALTTTVDRLPAVGDELTVAPHKRVVVDVGWRDRNNELQSVRLGTMISPAAPELAAALSTPGDGSPAQTPAGRSPAIPPTAIDIGSGRSSFAPPGAPAGVTWVFNNTSGFITQKCVLTVCTTFMGRLLSGYVNFAAGTSPSSPPPLPTSADAESPPGPILVGTGFDNVTVSVAITSPSTDIIPCFHQYSSTYVAYYCAMPVTVVSPQHWSGMATLTLPTGRRLANDRFDDHDDRYRVCRYTIAAARVLPHLVVPNLPYTTPPAIRNEEHPLSYVQVTTSLIGQNFLVIRAGDDNGTAYTCPADDSSTPEINGSTWHHQPSS